MTSWGGMVRRSNPEKEVRKEDKLPDYPKPSARADIEIIDEHGLLSPQQLDLLQNCASLNFSLGKYKSIAGILNSLKVSVYIRKGIIESNHKDFFDEMKKKWETNSPNIPRPKEFDQNSSFKLRGRYLRDKKIIELFPEEMKTEAEGPDGKVDDTMVMNLLISTLAHETMHAFFDRPRHEMFPYAYFVEEPLAEFGMLVYMNETEMPEEVRYWAYEDVSNKQSCYQYGAKLFDLRKEEYDSVRNYLEDYKVAEIGEFDVLDVDGYEARIWHYPVSGRPLTVAISGGTAVRAGISGTMISSKRFYFDAKSCWCKPGPRLFFTIKKHIYLDPLFAANYKRGDKIRISFYDKKGGLQFAGYTTIITQNRLSIPAEVAKEYARIFGINDKRLFGFYEATPASGSTTPAEWIAEEV